MNDLFPRYTRDDFDNLFIEFTEYTQDNPGTLPIKAIMAWQTVLNLSSYLFDQLFKEETIENGLEEVLFETLDYIKSKEFGERTIASQMQILEEYEQEKTLIELHTWFYKQFEDYNLFAPIDNVTEWGGKLVKLARYWKVMQLWRLFVFYYYSFSFLGCGIYTYFIQTSIMIFIA